MCLMQLLCYCRNCIPIIGCKDNERNILSDDEDGYDNRLKTYLVETTKPIF